MKTFALLAAAALCASQAFAADPAGARLNEIYISHSGTDDMEMIELVATPSAMLDNYMVLVVEGDGGGAGTLDRVWDLTGNMVPTDGYFVLGDTAEPALDFDIGASNRIENGTETIYLFEATDALAAAAVSALLGSNVDGDGDLVTDLVNFGTIIDHIAPIDTGFGSGDKVYDGAATIGPDGTFFPAGIFRIGDYPNPWCANAFLDFDDVANLEQPRTPGAKNVTSCFWDLGPGCPDSGGMTPDIALAGDPSPGGSITLTFANLTTGSLAGLLIGVLDTELAYNPACNLYVNSPFTLVIFPIPAPSFSLPGTVPAAVTGIDVYLQLLMQDGLTSDVIASNGLGMQIP